MWRVCEAASHQLTTWLRINLGPIFKTCTHMSCLIRMSLTLGFGEAVNSQSQRLMG
jgi:hypothetical protein